MMASTEFAPAWAVIEGVKGQCSNAFECDLIERSDDDAFTAVIYVAYKDPRALVKKFLAVGGQVIKISGGIGNWYHFTFKVQSWQK